MAAAALRPLCNIGNKKSPGAILLQGFSLFCAEKRCEHRPGPRKAGWRVCAVQAFLPQARILAEGKFTCPEHFNHRRVEAASGRRNPQKRTSSGCPFLW